MSPLKARPGRSSGPLTSLASYTELLEFLTDGACQAGGVHGSFGRFLAAQLHLDLCRSLIYLTPSVALAERAAGDLETFCPAASVLYFPPREIDGGASSRNSHAHRLELLYELLEAGPRIVVASLAAIWTPLLSPDSLRSRSLELLPGLDQDPQQLADQLVTAGYELVRSVTYPGEVSRRGGLLDLFSYGSPEPARIEYFGDTIESIRRFDPQTQVSVEPVDSVRVSLVAPGNRLRQGGPPQGNLLDYLDQDTLRIIEDRLEFDRYLAGADPSVTPRYSVNRRLRIDEPVGPPPVI